MSVYFIRAGDYIKVGFSDDPVRRFRNLFKSETRYSRPPGTPTALSQRELVAVIPGGLPREGEAHQALADFAVGSEWFVAEDPVLDFIERVKRDPGASFSPIRRAGGPAPDPWAPSPVEQARGDEIVRNLFAGMGLEAHANFKPVVRTKRRTA